MKPIITQRIAYFLLCKSLYEDVPKTLLKEHYRCHPKIIDFCNK
ncbi:C-terminal helicase domain-containing protein [Clostridium yunnanense]|nr:C-terminal helicase domain-containing protein [Clostridium yunnanense]